MSDYKQTLNLPQTAFPMKASLAQREPKQLEKWQQVDIYQQIRAKRQGAARFLLHDGPPYASGRPHMGTAMNKVIKDMIVKSRSLSGQDAPFVPGWDCHGLPIELNIEKKFGKPGDKLDARAFRQKCREFAQKQVDIQNTDFQRLGVLADWKNPYISMDRSYEANAIRALRRLVANGHLQRGYKPVHWCVACGSALAEAEVEYQDKTSPAIDVGFVATDNAQLADCFGCEADFETAMLCIWTTTPWTLPANEALCVHPNLDYVLIRAQQAGQTKILVVAEALQAAIVERYCLDSVTRLGTASGHQMLSLRCRHPLEEREVPVVTGEHVTTDAGTGIVHTAPSHGQDDYLVGQAFDLPTHRRIDGRGVFIDTISPLMNLHVFKANPVVIELLNDNAALLHETTLQHSYPHCWRHKTPLIFLATPQWFISMDKMGLRQQMRTAISETHWIPSWGQARIDGMVEGRPDWCVSRQRTWGIPITLLVHQRTGELHPDTDQIILNAANAVEEDGIDAWFDRPASAFTDHDVSEYDKVTDTLDVWFDSGVTHACVLEERPELGLPADLYFEGSDQHRGWFNSSLTTAVAMRGEPPFKTVLTHGYVVDGQGRKMSKSLGNGMYPADVVKNLGADVLRLWAAATDHTVDLNVSDEILKRSSEAYRRMRNTARFMLGNLFDCSEQDLLPFEDMLSLDVWICQQTAALQERIITAYEQYQFPKIYQWLHNFCSVTLGAGYLDVVKDRLYTCAANSVARRSAQTALYHVLQAFVRWIAPILSFTAEEIWQNMPGQTDNSVFLSEWYTGLEPVTKVAVHCDWATLFDYREEINKALESARADKVIGGALDAGITLKASGDAADLLEKLGDELRFFTLTSQARVQRQETGELTCDVIKLDDQKCARCWQRRADVGADAEHPTICGRCVTNLNNEERRQWC